MTRRLKPLREYPQWTVDVMMKFVQGSSYEQIEVVDRRTATSTAHMFNRARGAYVREITGGRNVEIVLDIVCRITNVAPGAGGMGSGGVKGQYLLEFTPRGLAILADNVRGLESKFEERLDVPGLETLAAPQPGVEALLKHIQVEPRDQAEEYFQGLLDKEEKVSFISEVIPACPPHEWNDIDICAKCGKPKEAE